MTLLDCTHSGSKSMLSLPRIFQDGSETEFVRHNKRKRISRLAVFRNKFLCLVRQSKSRDYVKAFREMISSWSINDVNSLVQEYEATSALREIYVSACAARPAASTLRHDLSNLFDRKFCADIDLIYNKTCFPAHRAILAARSSYFRKLLPNFSNFGTQLHVHIAVANVDLKMFFALLRYLYTDEIDLNEFEFDCKKIFAHLVMEFGITNSLEDDLKALLDSGDYSDSVLVFSNDKWSHISATSAVGKLSKFEFPCHKAILSARSLFFRSLLDRRSRSGEEATDRALKTPSQIVLDESVIPRHYAPVLLGALYHDQVDTASVMRFSTSVCSLIEIQSIASNQKCQSTIVDEAMEVYEIGQFLDFDVLSQGQCSIIYI